MLSRGECATGRLRSIHDRSVRWEGRRLGFKVPALKPTIFFNDPSSKHGCRSSPPRWLADSEKGIRRQLEFPGFNGHVAAFVLEVLGTDPSEFAVNAFALLSMPATGSTAVDAQPWRQCKPAAVETVHV